jgi:cold shock CspA family protein
LKGRGGTHSTQQQSFQGCSHGTGFRAHPELIGDLAATANSAEVMNMQLPLQITFHNLDRSTAIEDLVREKASKLERFAHEIMHCQVMVLVPHRHHVNGNHYQVRIDITVPGDEIVVNREPPLHTDAKELQVALRDAFDAARRQLEDYLRRRKHLVKTHEPMPHAEVSRLVPEEDHGFLRTPDGREIYFHRNSVLNGGFDRLTLGTEVTFVQQDGDKGPQASTVRPVGKHHHL